MKVVFDLSAGRLAIEGDGPELLKVLDAARQLAPDIKQIQIVTSAAPVSPAISEAKEPTNAQGLPGASKTLRQFARSLTLDNTSERLAAVAYYVNKIEGKQSFSPKEISGWFTMCGFQKPANMALAVFDAKRKYGFLDTIGRGMWRLSNQGENLITAKIEANPDQS